MRPTKAYITNINNQLAKKVMETTKQTKECLVIDERWISTTDQYPRIGERVLVRYLCDDGDGEQQVKYIMEDVVKALATLQAMFTGEFIFGQATHWRRLEADENEQDAIIVVW